MKVLIIGAGNMGKTYARSFLASRFIAAEDLYVMERSTGSVASIKDIPQGNIHPQAGEFISQADIIILAVKPQDFATLGRQIVPYVKPGQLVLSIMAGIKIAAIYEAIGVTKIVRAMPNLPAQIGMGMTVFTSSADIDKKELFIMQNLINTTGKSVYVEDEGKIDAATAISGSGPAYVYYFMEAMIQAGVKMGFTLSQAELLVNQTFMGAVHLHNQSDLTCNDWISRVASKGGTTEAALKIMKGHTVDANIEEALFAAFNRARELGS
ncbi:MAG TPA: pyrroline-5-carboxylate reductase [Chitinophagales bacterium]|nr:pyrroline-5-carboxylate reductase [Chitinophagales bacterium]